MKNLNLLIPCKVYISVLFLRQVIAFLGTFPCYAFRALDPPSL